MEYSRKLLTASCTIFAVFTSGCASLSSVTIGRGHRPYVHSDTHHHKGPPPHAPVHGYRHKQRHQGRDLEFVFDSGLGVYIVVGIPDHYYWDGYYLRIDGDQWYASVNLDRDWEPRGRETLPPGMKMHKKHSKSKHEKPGKRKGHGRKW